MSDAQFMHVAAYPIAGRKPKLGQPSERTWGIKNILGEGLRVAGFCSHVASPQLPIVHTLNAPVSDPRDFESWIVETMSKCREGHGAKLRKNALAIGTAIVSLPESHDPERIYDLRDLSEKFFARWFAAHDVTANFSIIHLDEAHPHVHIWATPSPKQYENGRWGLGSAFQLPGRELTLLQDMFHHAVGKPMGLARIGEYPQGRRFDRRTLRMLAHNPATLRYSPQYETGFLNALDSLAWVTALPPDLLFDIVREELDEQSVERLRERLAVENRDIEDSSVHYTMRDSDIEPKPFRRQSSYMDWNA